MVEEKNNETASHSNINKLKRLTKATNFSRLGVSIFTLQNNWTVKTKKCFLINAVHR